MIDRSYLDHLTATIAKHGHAIQYVAPCAPDTCAGHLDEVCPADDEGPPFACTVGLAQWPGRHYELAATGLDPQVTGQVLNGTASRLILDGLEPRDGLELTEVLPGRRLRLTPVHDPEELAVLVAFYPCPPPVWQVLVPDERGHFPDHPDYADLCQPLL